MNPLRIFYYLGYLYTRIKMQYEQGCKVAAVVPRNDTRRQQLIAMIKSDHRSVNRVAVVKQYRQFYGVDLKEAVAAVKELYAQHSRSFKS